MISAKQADLYAAIGVAIAVMNDSPDPMVQGAVAVLAKFIRNEDALHKIAEREGVNIWPADAGAEYALGRLSGLALKGNAQPEDIGRCNRIIRAALTAPQDAQELKRAIKAIPTRLWWNENGPVFNNQNGDDLILRKDVLAMLTTAQPADKSNDA